MFRDRKCISGSVGLGMGVWGRGWSTLKGKSYKAWIWGEEGGIDGITIL